MAQKYKFFINNKMLFIATNPALIEELIEDKDEYIIKPFEEKNLKQYIDILLGDENSSNWVIYGTNIDEIKEKFEAHFKIIKAAGGIVNNGNGSILLIHRRGFWDLPKGKMEKGELLAETAIREVIEETGIEELSCGEAISFKNYKNMCTYHAYYEREQWILKESYWFKMDTTFEGKLVPQLEEDIVEAKWVKIGDLSQYYSNMYPSIIEALQNY